MSFKAICNNVGDTIEVIYHLSGTISADSKIYKWDPINGWREHADVEFLPGGKSVLIRVTDGGDGDLDNVANAVVIDPSGVGILVAVGGDARADGSSGGFLSNIECFISTARSEAKMMGKLLAMIFLLAFGLFVLNKIRKNQ
ncbi:MAG: hypothetical protein HKO68_04235 [Desulfobacterales bacterium]|nr:hypothetical protein [Desulfobacterales bacterium]